MHYSKENTRTHKSNNPFDVLDIISKHPDWFLTSKTISCLQCFLNGYLAANPYPDVFPPIWDFGNWLGGVTGNKSSQATKENKISKILLTLTDGDEEKAFLLFFEYLNRFRSEYGNN